MTITTVSIAPGVFADAADHIAAAHWRSSDKIRFRDGQLQNIGGWRQATYLPARGIPRAIVSWALLSGQMVTAVATELKVYIYRAGERYDITPLRAQGTLDTDALSIFAGESIMTVSLTGHGCSPGDIIRISGADALGNVNPNGEWDVLDGSDPDSFTVNVGVIANTTVAAGGGAAISYEFDIHAGLASSAVAAGWGAGAWGADVWGGGGTTVERTPGRMWWLEPWGEDLLLCHSGSSIWRWRPSIGLTTRASVLSGAPDNNIGIVVSPEDRHLIVFGAGGDPLALQWPNQGTLSDWTPSETSTANTLRLLTGSRIISARKVGPEVLVWTDNAMYALRYTGGIDYSHALRQIAGQCTLVAPKAVAEKDGVTYWMGVGRFFVYDGASISRLPCTVENTVWETIDRYQLDKIIASIIPQFGEVVWFYPTTPSGENTHYVKYCAEDNAWDIGTIERTAFTSRGSTGQPFGADASGWLYEHDIGAVPQEVSVTLRCRKYASSPPVDVGPVTVDPSSTMIALRARGRHVAIRIAGTVTGGGDPEPWFAESASFTLSDGAQIMRISRMIPDVSFFQQHVRIGAFRFDVTPDGEQ